MNDWQSTYLGRGALPRDLSGFEIEAFFTYSESERRVIDDERRSPALKLALALQIGFLRMTGRLLEALRLVPPALWRHLGAQFEIDAPDLASLRTMYRRRRTLFEQQDLACSVLGFHDVTEAQRRALVRSINAELSRTSDRQRLLQFARRWLFIPPARWQTSRRAHYRRLHLPQDAAAFLEPLIERAKAGVLAVSKTAAEGILRVDEELHLTPLEPLAEDPKVTKLRAALDRRVGEAQLPELILAVDAQVRFSWIMLGREPRSSKELLMVYAGILAHGTALSAAETARMIPQLSAASVRQAMKWASDERRLAQACSAVLAFMHRHPISATWGRADLASSDMMSMETSQRVFVARNDPRRLTPSVGIYSHTRDRWGISYAQPMVLNERQAGAAIEGVVRDERCETAQLAVDTHGYTDVAMTLARGVGLDLCPRLKELSDRHLFLPRGSDIPENLKGICHASIDPAKAARHWDAMVQLFASVHSGHSSAITVLARYGSAARGDPLHEATGLVGR